jgi:hypothetical protein
VLFDQTDQGLESEGGKNLRWQILEDLLAPAAFKPFEERLKIAPAFLSPEAVDERGIGELLRERELTYLSRRKPFETPTKRASALMRSS